MAVKIDDEMIDYVGILAKAFPFPGGKRGSEKRHEPDA